MKEKECKNCHKTFAPRHNGGKPQVCCSINCRNVIWRKENKEKMKAAYIKWYYKDLDHTKKLRKNLRIKNHEKYKKYDREWKARWREKNPGLNAKLQAEWRKNNPEKSEVNRKEWSKNNRSKINDNWNRRYRIRYESDANFKIARTLRNRVRKALAGISKSTTTLKLLGVNSVAEVRNHIEKQFKPGMTWGNYRFEVWHIDHIRPVYVFDLKKKEEQLRAFHYTNLQPLWSKENLIKGKKLLK